MLLIGFPKAAVLKELLDQKEIEGITFSVEKQEGLSLYVNHSGESAKAKAVVKTLVAGRDDLKRFFMNIQILDEKGNIV